MVEGLDTVVKLAGQNLGPAALLGTVVLLVLFGLLIPLRTHNRELAAANKRGDEWRDTAKAQEQTIATQASTIHTLQATQGVLVQGSQTAAEALGTISKAGGENVAT